MRIYETFIKMYPIKLIFVLFLHTIYFIDRVLTIKDEKSLEVLCIFNIYIYKKKIEKLLVMRLNNCKRKIKNEKNGALMRLGKI